MMTASELRVKMKTGEAHRSRRREAMALAAALMKRSEAELTAKILSARNERDGILKTGFGKTPSQAKMVCKWDMSILHMENEVEELRKAIIEMDQVIRDEAEAGA
jgi:hypothetical protein